MHTRRSAIRDPWLIVAVGCALAFLALAAVVNGRGYVGFDQTVIAAVQGLPIPAGTWEAITAAGGILLVPVGVALVAWLVLRRQYRLAVIVAVALIAGTLFTEGVKQLVARPRPPGQPTVYAPGYSFPSGHTLNSTVTYGLMAFVASRSALPLAARRAIVAILVALIAAIGLSRIALGVHYPSDVLAGWLAGTAIVATVVVVAHVMDARERANARGGVVASRPGSVPPRA
jgi:membrane-associated phospholipid phosphatase